MTLCWTANSAISKRLNRRLGGRNDRAAVDGFGNDEAADKADGVEDRDEEDEIGGKTEDECRGFADRPLPSCSNSSLVRTWVTSTARLTAPGHGRRRMPLACRNCREKALIFP